MAGLYRWHCSPLWRQQAGHAPACGRAGEPLCCKGSVILCCWAARKSATYHPVVNEPASPGIM